MLLSAWKAGGMRHDHRGHPIFWRGGGDANAPALLLIHGFPTASWDWALLWPDLVRRHQLVAPDMIGFGFSAKPRPYGYSTRDQADLCESLLRSRGISEYHVLAHDYGDTVAQELLARRREPGERPALLSVCFLNGGLIPGAYRPRLIQRLLLSPLGPLVARAIDKRRFARSMRAIFGAATPPGPDLIDGFWELVTCNDGIAVIPDIIRYIRERERLADRWVGALREATVPLKLIAGVVDPISGGHMAEHYREVVPDADVTLLPAIGHYPQIEAPQAVLAAYLEFRRKIG